MIEELLRVVQGEAEADELGVIEAVSAENSKQVIVPPYYPSNGPVRLAFIGESVGAEEVKEGKPFAGAAGNELRLWCAEAGVDFEGAYLDNVYPVRRPEQLSEEMRERFESECRHRLVAIAHEIPAESGPFVAVLLGNAALKAVRGLDGIMKHRGSVYHTHLAHIVLAPVLNPAAVLRSTTWRRRCIYDMCRVKRILDEGYEPPPEFGHNIMRLHGEPELTDEDIKMLKEVRKIEGDSDDRCLAIDIETAALDDRITCVGFCWEGSPDNSFVFEWPLKSDRSHKADLIRKTVRMLCESKVAKVLHNGLYDVWWLNMYAGISVNNWLWDTMNMAQVMFPADNLSLEYITSIYVPEINYYKDEGKDHYHHAPKNPQDWTQLMSYCGLDVIATMRIYANFWVKHFKWNERAVDFFRQHYREMWRPMLSLMTRGVRADNKKRREVLEACMNESRSARDALVYYNDGEPLFTLTTNRDKRVYEALKLGLPLDCVPKTDKTFYSSEEVNKSIETIGAKTVSTKKLQQLLYGKLGLPVQYEKRSNGTETPTVNNLTLRKLLLEHAADKPDLAQVIKTAIAAAKAHKLAEFCYDNAVDPDGRMRFSLKQTPETGRLASSKSPRGTGKNSQNLPRDPRIRSWVLPERGHVLLKIDLSQVEARICFMYSRDPELIKLANLRPYEYDQHSENAVIIKLASSVEEVQQEKPQRKRQTAKAVVHGAQRNMQADTLYDTMLKDADIEGDILLLSVEEYAEALEAYHQRYPAIRGTFFNETRRKMQTERKLTNSWGRVWRLTYNDLDEEAMRRAYSFLLQSEAADLINTRAFVTLHDWIQYHRLKSRIMLHVHDELVFSCPVDEVYGVAQAMRTHIERPFTIYGNELSVPCEYGLGSSWACSYSWNRLPEKDEMLEAARSLV